MSPELEDLLRCETDRIEWKQSLKQSDEIFMAVCALANDLGQTGEPGYLLLGVDRSGKVVGLDFTGTSIDQQQQVISNRLRSTKLLPTPSFDVSVLDDGGLILFVVRVEPYDVPPIVQVNGVAWVRSGSTTVKASSADEARLRERRPEGHAPFDYRIVRSASLDDLDLRDLTARHAAASEADPHPDTFPELAPWLCQQELGYVQRLGRGIRLTRRLLERNGNPPLGVEVDGFTRVIVRVRP